MGNPVIAAPGSQRREDAQHRLARLDLVVEQLRALQRGRDGAGPRGSELSAAVGAWEREATVTRRRLTGSTRIPLTPTPTEAPR
jgi:hypothetical protein